MADSAAANPDSVQAPVAVPSPAPILPFGAKRHKFTNILSQQVKTDINRNEDGSFKISQSIHGVVITPEFELEFQDYAQIKLEEVKSLTWNRLSNESFLKQESRRGLLDFRINIPGGKNSAFTTIFGKPEVNLSVTGRANMNVGANIQNNKDPGIAPQQQKRVDPLFNQNLQLNISGTIGDKLNIRTDWDTERPFDYQNRLSIVYQGYEDEIIQKVELGNVGMETGNSLVRGGGALFGVKTTAQLGPVTLTSVLSQQQGKGGSETISGGSKETNISIRPSQYQDDQHFFIDFFSMQQFESAVSNPRLITVPLNNITQLQVYRRIITASQNNDGVRAAALADLGVVENPDGSFAPPDTARDALDGSLLNSLRSKENLTAEDLGVDQEDFVLDLYERLEPGVDYTFDATLGILSFNSRLVNQQVIGISFQYTDASGRIKQVGEIAPGGSDDVFYLKMIRPVIPSSQNRLWDLTARNFYYVGVNGVQQGNLDLRVWYTGVNPEIEVLPGVGGQILMQVMGIDRLNANGEATPDNEIDFGLTFNGSTGTLMFPFLEPFGGRIGNYIQAQGGEAEQVSNLAFTELYDQLPSVASQNNKDQSYEIRGSAKGGVESSYLLGFALVEGSVKVRSGGQELTEGTDYIVDYAIGSITIINDTYLKAGRDIEIEYENNQLVQIQQTTFAGVRAEYEVNDDIRFGSTLFRLKERPLSDKIRVGDEPINNTVVGLDGKASFDAPWLTRFIDKIPLLQTKEPSSVSFSGEWAQIIPGVARTNQVERQVQAGDLFTDEDRGVSFIDDFEGVRNTIPFQNAGRWVLSAAPAAIPGYDVGFDNPATYTNSQNDRISRQNLRAQFSWYSIPLGVSFGPPLGPESNILRQSDLFQRNFQQRQEDVLRTVDVFYNPTERGPYNYNMNLRNFLENEPERMWGGMTTTLPNNLANLDQNNYEFIEFWAQFVLPDGREPTASDFIDYEGKIFFDIGQISEDVIPNAQFNSEDGLEDRPNKSLDEPGISYIQPAQVNYDGAFAQQTIAEEDVGLDGVASSIDDADSEDVIFADFVQKMEIDYADQPDVVEKIRADPSNDDFVFWQDAANNDPSIDRIHKAFYRFLGYHEGNSVNPGRQSTPRPDTEGLLSPSNQNLVDKYFQYQLDVNPADTSTIQIGENYIVDKVSYGSRFYEKYYLFRIPLREFTRRIGGIEDFSQITHIRMWMSGYRQPFTMRFATFEFVGSQWRKAVNLYDENDFTRFNVATINREENLNRRPIPYVVPAGAIIPITRGQQNILANEQSMLLGVESLRQGDLRMITRVYNGGLNLINYSNMRMFIHGEGYQNRDDVELILRIGNNMETDYYEYRQPITPSDPNFPYAYLDTDGQDAYNARLNENQEEIWKPDENAANIILSVFNILKQARNAENFEIASLYMREIAELLPNEIDNIAPGAKVGVIGNPSLKRINEIGIGVLNPLELNSDGSPRSDIGVPVLDAEIWVNELRVSGYEDTRGWKANARTSVKLADFATVNVDYNQSTDGFGGINSSLGDRQRFNDRNINFSSTINAHKFLPDRFGWTFPVSVSYRNNFREEIFLTREADIRFDDFEQAVNTSDEFTEDEKQEIIQDKLEEIQTVREDFTFTVNNIGKQYSKSKILEYTLDKIRANFNYTTSDARSPQNARQYNWSYQTGLSYNLQFRNVKMLRPFGFLENTPLVKPLSEFRLGYMPSSIAASTNLNRKYDETARRIFPGQPDIPLQQNHNMLVQSDFSLNYNLTPNIALSYSSNTAFNLAEAGTDSTRARRLIEGDTTRFYLRPTWETIQNILTVDSVAALRSAYTENFSATWRPKLNKIKALEWVNYSASYRGSFNWNNNNTGLRDTLDLGATIRNSGTISHTLKLDTKKLFEKVGFYAELRKKDEQETRARAAARAKKRAAKKAEKQKEKGAEETKPAQNNRRRNPAPENSNPEEEQNHSITPAVIARKVFLGLFSFNSIDVTYTDRLSASQAGYTGTAPIFYAFNGSNESNFSPPLGYRLGFFDRLGADQLVLNPNQRIGTNWVYDDNLSMRTRLALIQNVSVDLNWGVTWGENNTITRTLTPDPLAGDLVDQLFSQAGSYSTTTWAFGQGYESLFRRQLQMILNDIPDGATGGVISDANGNQDGESALNPVGLLADFKSSYIGGGLRSAEFAKLGFGAFPLPNWSLSIQGVENMIDGLSDIFQRVSINHQYVGRYNSGYTFNNGFDQNELSSQIGGFTLRQPQEQFAPQQSSVEQNFSPLVGIDMSFRNGIRANLEYRVQRRVAFSFTSSRIDETSSRGGKMTIGFEKRGFRLPFFKKLKNTVTINTTVNYSDEEKLLYNLGLDLGSALDTNGEAFIQRDASLADFDRPDVFGSARLQGSLIIGYQFSQMINANFEYGYTHIFPKTSQTIERIDQTIRFNIVVAIRSN